MSTTTAGSDAKTRVLQAIDIVELIGRSVQLKRRGKDYVGLCPFHAEKTPSFHVSPAKQFFHCYGCKASGNAIDFIIRRDRVEFVEALHTLARTAGIELPRFGGQKQNTGERHVLLEAHSAACSLFEKSLMHPEFGAGARSYLHERGFTPESIKRFQIGLAVDSWDALLKSPAMKKFTPPQLVLAGLVKPREGGGFYDTFRNRIMFPIRDEQGRVIAFGGRVMPGSDDPAKYLNSPETPLFAKSRCMFGLDLARPKIVETHTVAVVEGYTDVVMAHQLGAANVVSVLGTAMSEQHVAILRRFAERIVLLFDADTAGDQAVNRAVELFLTQPIEIAIASIPDGLDPDEYLLKHGLEAFNKLLAGAQDALSYKWRQLQREFGSRDDLTGQQKAVEAYLAMLAAARGAGPIDTLRWGSALARVSRLTDIPADELNRRFRARRRPAAQARPGDEPKMTASPAQPLTAQDRAERWILGVLLHEPKRWRDVQSSVCPQDFADERHRRLAGIYWTHQQDEGEPVFSEFLGEIQDDELKALAAALVEEAEELSSLEQTLRDAIGHLRQARLRQEKSKLVAELRHGGDGTQAVDEIELLRKLQERAREPDLRRTAT